MFGKNFSQIKTALIKAGKIEADATDAEVSQAAIDMIGQKAADTEGGTPDPKGEKADATKVETKEAKTYEKAEAEKTPNVQAQIATLEKGLLNVTEGMKTLNETVLSFAKSGKQSAVQGEKGTPETPPKEKQRAYMNSDINKGVQFKSRQKTGKVVLVTDDEDEE